MGNDTRFNLEQKAPCLISKPNVMNIRSEQNIVKTSEFPFDEFSIHSYFNAEDSKIAKSSSSIEKTNKSYRKCYNIMVEITITRIRVVQLRVTYILQNKPLPR